MVTEVPVVPPSRVMVNREGDATTWNHAFEAYRITPDIIFVRNDGWSLGAPRKYENVAYRLWENDWIGFARKGDEFYCDIEDYWPSK